MCSERGCSERGRSLLREGAQTEGAQREGAQGEAFDVILDDAAGVGDVDVADFGEAAAGQVVVSDAIYEAASELFPAAEPRQVILRGRSDRLAIRVFQPA